VPLSSIRQAHDTGSRSDHRESGDKVVGSLCILSSLPWVCQMGSRIKNLANWGARFLDFATLHSKYKRGVSTCQSFDSLCSLRM